MTTMRIHPINASGLRTKAREILEESHWRGKIFEVRTFGTPSVMIISVDLFEQWAQAMGITIERLEPGTNPAGDAGKINLIEGEER